MITNLLGVLSDPDVMFMGIDFIATTLQNTQAEKPTFEAFLRDIRLCNSLPVAISIKTQITAEICKSVEELDAEKEAHKIKEKEIKTDADKVKDKEKEKEREKDRVRQETYISKLQLALKRIDKMIQKLAEDEFDDNQDLKAINDLIEPQPYPHPLQTQPDLDDLRNIVDMDDVYRKKDWRDEGRAFLDQFRRKRDDEEDEMLGIGMPDRRGSIDRKEKTETRFLDQFRRRKEEVDDEDDTGEKVVTAPLTVRVCLYRRKRCSSWRRAWRPRSRAGYTPSIRSKSRQSPKLGVCPVDIRSSISSTPILSRDTMYPWSDVTCLESYDGMGNDGRLCRSICVGWCWLMMCAKTTFSNGSCIIPG